MNRCGGWGSPCPAAADAAVPLNVATSSAAVLPTQTRPPAMLRPAVRLVCAAVIAASYAAAAGGAARAQEDGRPPVEAPAPEIAAAEAATAAEMKPYTEVISGAGLSFKMAPIPGGTFTIGSPEDEPGRNDDEGPQRQVEVSPFWMGVHEVTWNEYESWAFKQEIARRELAGLQPSDLDVQADAVTRPTKNYTDMTFDMGHDGFPAICMTQLSAKMYCQWLSAKTGRFYRLPTEAEWEFACRAGAQTAYHFGDDPADLDKFAWHQNNSEWTYHPVGMKEPNPFGLYDMHGNVAEWCLDQYDPKFYATVPPDETFKDPLNVPTTLYPRTVRGGSWDQPEHELRSAARLPSTNDWKAQDPQLPQSIWWHTDSIHVGFRVVRPLHEPSEEEKLARQLIPRPEDVPEWGLREGFIDD